MSKDYFIIPIFVPHLGCPHDCVFCNQRKITGLSTDVTIEYVEQTIKEYISTFPKGEINVEVAFYGGSFTGIDMEMQKDLLSVPLKFKEEGKIDGIRLSTRPDYIDKETLDLLKTYKVDTIELGVQSLNDEVLNKSGRGHNSKQVFDAAKLIKDNGFNLGLQMMIGLVADTKEKDVFTAKEFIKLDPYCVRIYPTLVIKDTFLEKMYNKGDYKSLSLEESIDITTDLLMLFQYHSINVIRIGLQPTENIRLGRDVVAGPFHSSYRQLVESNIYKIILKDYLDAMDPDVLLNKTIKIKINNKNISNIVGQRSKNIKYLIERYNLKNIKIFKADVLDGNIDIEIGDLKDNINKKETLETYLKQKILI